MAVKEKIQRLFSYLGIAFLFLVISLSVVFWYFSYKTDGYKNEVIDTIFAFVRSSDFSEYSIGDKSITDLGMLEGCIGEDNSVTVYYEEVTYTLASLKCNFERGEAQIESKLRLLDNGQWVVDKLSFHDIYFSSERIMGTYPIKSN